MQISFLLFRAKQSIFLLKFICSIDSFRCATAKMIACICFLMSNVKTLSNYFLFREIYNILTKISVYAILNLDNILQKNTLEFMERRRIQWLTAIDFTLGIMQKSHLRTHMYNKGDLIKRLCVFNKSETI